MLFSAQFNIFQPYPHLLFMVSLIWVGKHSTHYITVVKWLNLNAKAHYKDEQAETW